MYQFPDLYPVFDTNGYEGYDLYKLVKVARTVSAHGPEVAVYESDGDVIVVTADDAQSVGLSELVYVRGKQAQINSWIDQLTAHLQELSKHILAETSPDELGRLGSLITEVGNIIMR